MGNKLAQFCSQSRVEDDRTKASSLGSNIEKKFTMIIYFDHLIIEPF